MGSPVTGEYTDSSSVETAMKAPYTIFGITKMVPVVVFNSKGQLSGETTWEDDLWIEREEDWYALSSPQLVNKKVRVITRDAWLQA